MWRIWDLSQTGWVQPVVGPWSGDREGTPRINQRQEPHPPHTPVSGWSWVSPPCPHFTAPLRAVLTLSDWDPISSTSTSYSCLWLILGVPSLSPLHGPTTGCTHPVWLRSHILHIHLVLLSLVDPGCPLPVPTSRPHYGLYSPCLTEIPYPPHPPHTPVSGWSWVSPPCPHSMAPSRAVSCTSRSSGSIRCSRPCRTWYSPEREGRCPTYPRGKTLNSNGLFTLAVSRTGTGTNVLYGFCRPQQ